MLVRPPRVVAVLAALVTLSICSAARADGTTDSGLFSLEAVMTQWSHLPPLTLGNGSGASPLLVGLRSPASAPVRTYGLGFDFGVREDWGVVSVLHLRYSGSVGTVDGTGVADESPVDVQTGALNVFELGVPIIVPPRLGVQWVGDRFKLGVAIDWGITYAWASANMNDPIDGASSGGFDRWDLYARAEVSACIRLTDSPHARDPGDASWACLTAMPSLYDFGWWQGQSLGVRIDL
jgi:hypothetical protein